MEEWEPDTMVPFTLAELHLLQSVLDRALDDWAREGIPAEAVMVELKVRYQLQKASVRLEEMGA